MDKVFSYVKETLGVDYKVNKADGVLLDCLPLYLNSTYDIWKTILFEKEVFLLAQKTSEHLTPLQYQKHKELLEKKMGAVIVFILSDLKAYDRNRLAQKKINFIIEDKQIFIPQLLIDLKDFLPKMQIVAEKLQPAAQVMILFHIQRSSLEGFNYKQIAQLLDYSYLTISRAVENLVSLKLCQTEGAKEKRLVIAYNKKKLWEKAQSYMKKPIKKTLFINDVLPEELIKVSAINALAFYSDLNNDRNKQYAISHSIFVELKKKGLIKQTNQYDGDYKIELWRYNPNILTDTNCVDPLSLYISFKDSVDERIELALEQIIEKIKW